MSAPVRIQLSRRSGFNLQAHSQSVNGLAATMVARPTRWGNPYKASPAYRDDYCTLPAMTVEGAVAAYRERMQMVLATWPSVRTEIEELRGRNLACWCKAGSPCHADVLLDLANRPRCDAVSTDEGGRAAA